MNKQYKIVFNSGKEMIITEAQYNEIKVAGNPISSIYLSTGERINLDKVEVIVEFKPGQSGILKMRTPEQHEIAEQKQTDFSLSGVLEKTKEGEK